MHKIEKGWYWKNVVSTFSKKKPKKKNNQKKTKEKLMAGKFMMYCYKKQSTQQ